MYSRLFLHKRRGFTLIEGLVVAMLLGICAAGITSIWSVCYTMNDHARRAQAGKNIMEQEMERVRRLNWGDLAEQPAWAARYYYNASGGAVGAVGSASPVTNGFTSWIKVETMDSDALLLDQDGALDASGGNADSLRRVILRVQPSGVSIGANPPTAEAGTYLAQGGA